MAKGRHWSPEGPIPQVAIRTAPAWEVPSQESKGSLRAAPSPNSCVLAGGGVWSSHPGAPTGSGQTSQTAHLKWLSSRFTETRKGSEKCPSDRPGFELGSVQCLLAPHSPAIQTMRPLLPPGRAQRKFTGHTLHMEQGLLLGPSPSTSPGSGSQLCKAEVGGGGENALLPDPWGLAGGVKHLKRQSALVFISPQWIHPPVLLYRCLFQV